MGIVTLVSGGLDSTLMSMLIREEGVPLFPLFIDYGQLAVSREWEACKRLHRQFDLPDVVHMDLSGFGKIIPSGITDTGMRINEDAFLPGRNLLFILAGASYALKVKADSVAIGLLDPSYSLFPDQSEEFINKSERIIEKTMEKHINILTPLIGFSKRDVLLLSSVRGLKDTYSCHAGRENPCGECVACLEFSIPEERR